MPVIHRDTDYAVRALAHLAQSGGVVAVSTLADMAQALPTEGASW